MNENNEFTNEKPQTEDEYITIKHTTIYLFLIPVMFAIGLLVGFFVWGRASTDTSAEVAELRDLITQQSALLAEISGLTADSGDGNQGGGNTVANTGEDSNPIEDPQEAPRYDIAIYEDDPVQGADDALITIIEFSDFQCPYCQRHNAQVKSLIMEIYGENVRYIHKDFPLTSIHPEAVPSAEAAKCAQEQGVFWEYHDLLFAASLGLDNDAYYAYADQLGLDLDAFGTCYTERRYEEQVQMDLDFAVNLGVRSTPTFFINGIAIVGAQGFDVFAQVIDSELGNQ